FARQPIHQLGAAGQGQSLAELLAVELQWPLIKTHVAAILKKIQQTSCRLGKTHQRRERETLGLQVTEIGDFAARQIQTQDLAQRDFKLRAAQGFDRQEVALQLQRTERKLRAIGDQ